MLEIEDAIPPDHPDLTLVRAFTAPRALVFRACIDPQHLARWWGPHGFSNPVCEFDARPDGALRIHMRAPDGTIHIATGIIREAAEPDRLVFTVAVLDGDGGIWLETLTTLSFADKAGKTELTLHVRVLQASAAAAGNLAGMEVGWSQSLERLGALVAAL